MRLSEFAGNIVSRTLYVHRPLLNADELCTWAREQGFPFMLPLDDLHVTVAFSKAKVDWSLTNEADDEIEIEGGKREVKALGDKGAVVLCFEAPALQARWKELRDDVGCSWDFPSYMPHVSITYAGKDLDPSGMKPFDGVLRFGPEEFQELDDEWSDDVKEVSLTQETP